MFLKTFRDTKLLDATVIGCMYSPPSLWLGAYLTKMQQVESGPVEVTDVPMSVATGELP